MYIYIYKVCVCVLTCVQEPSKIRGGLEIFWVANVSKFGGILAPTIIKNGGKVSENCILRKNDR